MRATKFFLQINENFHEIHEYYELISEIKIYKNKMTPQNHDIIFGQPYCSIVSVIF